MLSYAPLPLVFWDEPLFSSTFIMNRLPTPLLIGLPHLGFSCLLLTKPWLCS